MKINFYEFKEEGRIRTIQTLKFADLRDLENYVREYFNSIKRERAKLE